MVDLIAFSPDGKTVAYGAEKEGKCFLVVGDKKGEEFEYVGSPSFSSDGKKVVFGAEKGDEFWWKVRNLEAAVK